MSLKSAILFNGAAAHIAQEVGMLDLLLGHVPGVPGVGLNIQEDVQFIGGLSSGALMTFVVNAAFCEDPILSWDEFKDTILFPLTTEQVYTGETLPLDTTPLEALLTEITKKVNYHTLQDLPFDSAILTLAIRNTRTVWLTNIARVADKLPRTILHVYESIRKHQLNLELVSALMSSTAIPIVFPPHKLFYRESRASHPIRRINHQPAYFWDGGTLGVFNRFQEFFKVYNQKFDKIFFISPNFTSSEEEAYKLIDEKHPIFETETIDSQFIVYQPTQEFLQQLKEYNADGHLANEIFVSRPDVTGYNPLDFDQEKDQYDDTIRWGQNHSNQIAINLNNIDDLD